MSSLIKETLTPENSYYQVTEPFTPIDHVTEAINGREKEGINEREHSVLFEHMQEMAKVLRGEKR